MHLQHFKLRKKPAQCFSDQHDQQKQAACHGEICVRYHSENIFYPLHGF